MLKKISRGSGCPTIHRIPLMIFRSAMQTIAKTAQVVVGFGPAGMFAALILAKAGLKTHCVGAWFLRRRSAKGGSEISNDWSVESGMQYSIRRRRCWDIF